MALVTSGRRTVLRRLKMEFDALFASVDPSMDRSDPEYVDAEEAYKDWRRAIDAEALDLLDDLEEAEAKIGHLLEKLSSPEAAQTTVADRKPTEADTVALFETIEATKQDPEASTLDPVPPEVWADESPSSVRQIGRKPMGLSSGLEGVPLEFRFTRTGCLPCTTDRALPVSRCADQ